MKNQYRLLVATLALVIAGLPMGEIAAGASACEVEVLSDGATSTALQAVGQYVLWADYQADDTGAHDYAIHVYDTDTGQDTTIHGDHTALAMPQLEDGVVVWGTPDLPEHAVYVHDLSTDTTTQIANTDGGISHPQISSDLVYWTEWGDVGSTIMLHDLTTGETRRVTYGDYNQQPAIDGDTLVWITDVMGQPEIALMDVRTNETTLLTDSQDEANADVTYGAYHAPQISDGLVFWQRQITTSDRQRLAAFYGYDGRETQQIVGNLSDGSAALVDYPYVVWSSSDGNDAEVFLYNLEDGSTSQLTDNDFDDHVSEIGNHQVVWGSYYEGVYLYDILSGEITTISDAQYVGAPHSGDDFVVWLANVDVHGGDVVICRINTQ